MEIKKIRIENFRGILNPTDIKLKSFNLFIGRNDSGKSTILKALDLFLNEPTFNLDYKNIHATSDEVSITLFVKTDNTRIVIDESIKTTFESEDLLNENGLLQIKKTWITSKQSRITPDFYIYRKIYSPDDFLSATEKQLIDYCKKNSIETSKANGEEYNNVEKRTKLRELYQKSGNQFNYDYEKFPSSGTSRLRTILKEIKDNLPRFEYFKADTSLSETDTAIQNYFKELATSTIKSETNTTEIEISVTKKLTEVLENIASKINNVVPENEEIKPAVEFDWSRIVKTSFQSTNEEGDIPFGSRGDGFRRITMMAYFEHLAETSRTEKQNILFGFEEPETFLHPTAQELLYDKLFNLSKNNYQVIITTHSPIIVAKTHLEDLSHISKEKGEFKIAQKIQNLKEVANDIGVTVDNQFITFFEKAKFIIFVEGTDDAKALRYVTQQYKTNNLINKDLKDLGIITIPTGGCGSIKHWVTFDLIKDLNKDFIIFQDSDKKNELDVSEHKSFLESLGFKETKDFYLTKKHELENYMPPTALNRLVPNSNLTYGDFDDVKEICKKNKNRDMLGKEKVLDKHFCSLTLKELQDGFYDGKTDEFLTFYKIILDKINN
jgi:predicted ATP-dependent endonuclease of OLD family